MEEKSAFVMIKFEHKDRFVSAYKELYSMDKVVSCDAVKGIYDLVLFLRADNMEKCLEDIKKLDGIKEADFMPLIPRFVDEKSNMEEKKTEKNSLLSSYVMVESDSEKKETVHRLLCSIDTVKSCDPVEGKFDMILFMESESFDDINKVIKERIKYMDGVLRIKECAVISMS
ncbi:MAG: Lrp/AsnC ligand binding domain-containing protein [Candidatus Eremiobacterota bacterium]